MNPASSGRARVKAVVSAVLRRPRVVLAALLIVVAVAMTWRIVSMFAMPRLSPDAARIARETQRTAATFPTASLMDHTSFEHAIDTLIQAEMQRRGESPEADSPWRDAVRAALEFLRAWSHGDPDHYLGWARARGRDLPTAFPIYQTWTMDVYADRYLGVVGRPMPEYISFEAYYRDYFTAYFSRMGGALRPDSIAIDPRAILVDTTTFTHWSEYLATDPDRQDDGLGAEFWHGKLVYSGMLMLWPDEVIPDVEAAGDQPLRWEIGTIHDARRLLYAPLLRDHGAVLVAEVRLVYRSEAGVSVPVAIWMKQRPSDEVWRIDGLSISNVDADVGVLEDHAFAPPF